MKNIKNLLVMLGVLFLSSCSLFSPVKMDSGSSYMLYRSPDYLPKKPMRSASIMVNMPDTNPAYDTTQMAYTTQAYQVAYFSKNSWAETPAEMLEPLIVQTLQKAKYFKTVAAIPFVGRANFLLNTKILILEQDFTRSPSIIRFKLRAQLSNVQTGQVVGTKEFTISQEVRQNTPYGGVIAANAAVAHVLGQLAVFCREQAK